MRFAHANQSARNTRLPKPPTETLHLSQFAVASWWGGPRERLIALFLLQNSGQCAHALGVSGILGLSGFLI